MLLTSQTKKTPSVERLIASWARLYTPDLSALPFTQSPSLYSELVEAASPVGRAETAAKLNWHFIDVTCQIASVQTNSLYTYMQNAMDLREVRQLADSTALVYRTLVDLYRQNALNTSFSELLAVALRSEHAIPLQNTPAIEQVANALEPSLLEFQEQHAQAKDGRTPGFLTTQFNFCNQSLRQKLTPVEQVLLRPYLKFVEEQIAHPWQRVCYAAADYPGDHSIVSLVATLTPLCEEIAQAIYQRLKQALPYYTSHRGRLSHPDVTHSCIRDLKMFQAYLWLCVLEANLAPIEQELLKLCVMVLPSVGVKWELVATWTQIFADEMLRRIEVSQQPHVLPYTDGIQQIFLNARAELETVAVREVTYSRR